MKENILIVSEKNAIFNWISKLYSKYIDILVCKKISTVKERPTFKIQALHI